MNKKKIFLSTLLVIGIVLLAIGFFAGAISNVTADEKTDKIEDKNYIDSIRSEDSVETKDGKTKTYIFEDRKLILEDSDGVIFDMNLITPYENKVIPGESTMIAEWFLIDFNDKTEIFEKIDSYSIKDGYKVKSKDYIWKYLVETEVTECYDSSKINNKTSLNETVEVCYDYIKEDWIQFLEAKDLPHKNIYIGLFTNTIDGEHVEFIPTAEGFDIYEWASFLVTNLVSYYKMDDSSGDLIDSLGSNNITYNGALYSQTGKIGTAIGFDGNDDTGQTGITAVGATTSVNFWMKRGTPSGQDVVISKWGTFPDRWAIGFVGGSTTLQANVGSDNSWRDIKTSTDTNYHMVTLVIRSDGYDTYYDGSIVGNDISTSYSDDGDEIYLADFDSGTGSYIGDIDELGIWSRALNQTDVDELYNDGDGFTYPFEIAVVVDCQFSGFVFDEGDSAISGANVTIWNQFNVSEFYENTTNAQGSWLLNITNSTNTYMAGAYFNNTLIGQLKPFISGTC